MPRLANIASAGTHPLRASLATNEEPASARTPRGGTESKPPVHLQGSGCIFSPPGAGVINSPEAIVHGLSQGLTPAKVSANIQTSMVADDAEPSRVGTIASRFDVDDFVREQSGMLAAM